MRNSVSDTRAPGSRAPIGRRVVRDRIVAQRRARACEKKETSRSTSGAGGRGGGNGGGGGGGEADRGGTTRQTETVDSQVDPCFCAPVCPFRSRISAGRQTSLPICCRVQWIGASRSRSRCRVPSQGAVCVLCVSRARAREKERGATRVPLYIEGCGEVV